MNTDERGFECTGCGHKHCTRVRVTRPNGAPYDTEFVRCSGCRLMYHWDGDVPPPPPRSGANPWALVPGSEPALSSQQLRDIEEAAARARRRRKRR